MATNCNKEVETHTDKYIHIEKIYGYIAIVIIYIIINLLFWNSLIANKLLELITPDIIKLLITTVPMWLFIYLDYCKSNPTDTNYIAALAASLGLALFIILFIACVNAIIYYCLLGNPIPTTVSS